MENQRRLLDSLNAAQRQAVTAAFGPSLILAGAGSGKTLVLVRRIAWFVEECHISPASILAVTFTNKAAKEMQGRLAYLLGDGLRNMWVGTFHGLSHKLLRLHYKEANLIENFQVIDSDDQLHIIRKIFKNLNINEDRFEPKGVQNFINRKKDEGIRASQITQGSGLYDQLMIDVYREYERICEEGSLVDFAELILRSYELLKGNAELLAYYQARFTHFLVDEFQDTNTIQYQWLSLFAEHAQSVTVVGDDDQSIYGWRGAKVENIRRFEREFKNTSIIRLEQNYRSTETILSAANALIANNDNRLGKTLWTEGEKGEPIVIYAAFNEEDEALYVMRQIRVWVENGGKLSEVGVLYRSNAQSRLIEEALVRAGIPYTIYGGLRFFERQEIKDALAYLRLTVNHHDDAAFERVVNVPPRGVGDKSIEKIKETAQFRQTSLWEAAQFVLQERSISSKALSGLKEFVDGILRLSDKENSRLTDLMEETIRESGLLKFYREQLGEKAQSRAENLEELINATKDFEEEQSYLDEEAKPITAFLAYTALEAGERASNTEDSVQLMTLHSAKGLEFPLVFICGLEDGLFPHHYAKENPKNLEEERRLCYVGITRAKRRLYLTYAEKRRIFGRDEDRQASRFVGEIPAHLTNEVTRKVNVKTPFRISSPSFFSKNVLSNQSAKLSATLKEDFEGFSLGERVCHPKFGEGTIVDHEGSGERARVHIRFDKHGHKWLALAYAKLEAVS